MSDTILPEGPKSVDNKVLPFKKISVEKAIENIYNTVSKKIPLKYETVEDKKVIKVPQKWSDDIKHIEFNELLVWSKRYFEYSELLYFLLIFLVISFLFQSFLSKTKIYSNSEFIDVIFYCYL